MNAKEFFNTVLPKFQGTKKEQIRAISQHCADTHEQWVKDIEKQESEMALAKRFQA